jgi:tRNA (mo5U34)-methyltransferase
MSSRRALMCVDRAAPGTGACKPLGTLAGRQPPHRQGCVLATTKLEFPARNVPMLPASGTFGHSRRGSGLPTSVPGVNLAPKSRASGRCRLERRYRISHGKKIQQRIDEITWYHEFDFGNGLRAVSKTPQVAGHRRIWSFIEGELDRIAFSSKAVLDIGCWDGYWSFYAERRGAKSVLASDDQTQNWAGSSGLMLAHRLLKSKVALDLERSVYDLAPLGRNFDIILCLGVYYHLVDPFYAFAQIRHCCHDDTIVLFEGDATRGLREDTLRYDLSNHSLPIFLPTEQTLGDMLRGAYLEPVRSTWMHPEPRRNRRRSRSSGVGWTLPGGQRSLPSASRPRRSRTGRRCRPSFRLTGCSPSAGPYRAVIPCMHTGGPLGWTDMTIGSPADGPGATLAQSRTSITIKSRIIIDLSTLARWDGPPVGILRCQAKYADYALRNIPERVVDISGHGPGGPPCCMKIERRRHLFSEQSPFSVGSHGAGTSTPPRCLDGGDVDLLHRHHRLEGALCLAATSRERIG